MAKLLKPFLSQAFEALRAENVEGYKQVLQAGAECEVQIQNASEVFTMRFSTERVLFSNTPSRAAKVSLRLRDNVVDDLVSNETSLIEALRANQIMVIGPIDELAILNEALQLFIRGAVRCPSLPALLKQYQSQGTGVTRREAI